MKCLVTTVDAVRDHGDNLTIVTVGGHEVVANKREDGSRRWSEGQVVVYIPEGSVIPSEVLKERGYWDNEKDRGLLDGGQRNRVKGRKFGGYMSRGLIFAVTPTGPMTVFRSGLTQVVKIGDDVGPFLGITGEPVEAAPSPVAAYVEPEVAPAPVGETPEQELDRLRSELKAAGRVSYLLQTSMTELVARNEKLTRRNDELEKTPPERVRALCADHVRNWTVATRWDEGARHDLASEIERLSFGLPEEVA